MSDPGDVTRFLAGISRRGRPALDGLFPLVYRELRRLAQRQLGGERPDHTLGATALVHEAFLSLSSLERLEWRNRQQFFAVAAGAMRRVLVDHAVRRSAAKRGGGWWRVELRPETVGVEQATERLLALDEALRRLERLEPRQARVVECRFFAGLDIAETAEALGISPATVKRDWTMARALLHRELES
jgi:RNA polymerase sigma factor (TIGR02999 family)